MRSEGDENHKQNATCDKNVSLFSVKAHEQLKGRNYQRITIGGNVLLMLLTVSEELLKSEGGRPLKFHLRHL